MVVRVGGQVLGVGPMSNLVALAVRIGVLTQEGTADQFIHYDAVICESTHAPSTQ